LNGEHHHSSAKAKKAYAYPFSQIETGDSAP
jgi:hypothetical protein